LIFKEAINNVAKYASTLGASVQIEERDGNLLVRSVIDEGTVIVLTLPLAGLITVS